VLKRETAAADLDTTDLLNLLAYSDPLGVLSIYVDAATDARSRAIDINNRLNDLRRRIGVDGPTQRAHALDATLERIVPAVERLLDPRSSGRGRALFVAISADEISAITGQLRMPNRVVLDGSPFVHPLLEVLDEGRPAGVAVSSHHAVDVFDWRQGTLRRLTRIVLDHDPTRRGRPGPVAPAAGRAQQTTPMREQHQRRVRDHRLRFLERAAANVSELADDRGWDRVLVSGDDRLTGPLLDALPEQLREGAIRDPRRLDTYDEGRLAATVSERLERAQAEREVQLTTRVRDAAMSGVGGALGLSEVLAALNDGRVSHLIYDPEVRFHGAVGDDGRLSTTLERRPAAGRLVDEPRLTERMVERSLRTGADITPVAGAAATMLAGADGVAALLRW
jgi:hypothetical protein